MAYDMGPRAHHVFNSLRERILAHEWGTSGKMPPHLELAAHYGVAPLTMRQVLARLEEEGYVSREQGRGTFVRQPSIPAIVIVDDEIDIATLLGEYVRESGRRPIVTTTTKEAMHALETDENVVLVLSDVRVPSSSEGLDFIRAVRRRWPGLPLAAVTAFPDDLAPLHGTPEWPVLVLTKPFRASQVREAIRLVTGSPGQRREASSGR